MTIRDAMRTAALFLVCGVVAWAQEAPKWELTPDYSFARYAPSASYTKGHSFNGGGGRLVFNVNRWLGIGGDLQGYNSNTTQFNIPSNPTFPNGFSGSVSGNLFTYLFGPVIKFRGNRVEPFFDVLPGAAHTNVYGNAFKTICQPVAGDCSFSAAPDSNAFALSAGGGLDIPVNRRIYIRPGEFDYLYTRFTNQFNNAGQNNFRYLAGLGINMGLPDLTPPNLACAVQPSSVFPGDPATATATATALSTNKNNSVIYDWSGTGVTGNGASANVATGSLNPGNYTVNATVKEGKKGKEGLKPYQTAQCSASLTVKPFEPPTVSCSASPSSIKPGDSSTITATGMSPQNRPLSYTYSAASGTVSGNGTTATFASTGAPTGGTTVTCNVSDDKGNTASGSTSVDIVAPSAPPAPTAQGQCSISFATDKKRPTRVDNEAKACLDQVALSLQQQPDSKLAIVSSSTSAEASKKVTAAAVAAQRAVNVKDYLVKEKGIDPSRISVATTTTEGQQAQDYLIPAGASLPADVSGATPVDESTVKPQVRKPLR
jgi:outer membrane protein OmpA-like peptidoglycan-associated protein